MLEELTIADMILRAAVASLLGGAIGWDRERQEKAAGLRTMMLVSLGAAGAIMATIQVTAGAHGTYDQLSFDPIRVIEGVLGGIGFLGAGSIIQSRGEVKGMTTAATIWAAAGIGIASGLGQFALAGVLTGFVLVMLIVISTLKGPVLPDRTQKNESDQPA